MVAVSSLNAGFRLPLGKVVVAASVVMLGLTAWLTTRNNGKPQSMFQPSGAIVRSNSTATLRISYETTAENRCHFDGDLRIPTMGRIIPHQQETTGPCRPEDIGQGIEKLIEKIYDELRGSPGLLRDYVVPLIDEIKTVLTAAGVY